MNKQEAIECIKNFSEYPATYPCAIVRTPSVIEVIKEMYEPQITDEQAWNKIAEAYPETVQSLRVTLDHAVFGQEAEPQKVSWRKAISVLEHHFQCEIPRNLDQVIEGFNSMSGLMNSVEFELDKQGSKLSSKEFVLEALERYKQKVKVPPVVFKFLNDNELLSKDQKLAYLIRSRDGDHFYLTEMLPCDGIITDSDGDELFSWVEKQSHETLLNIWKYGYEVEEEPYWTIGFENKYLQDIQFKKGLHNLVEPSGVWGTKNRAINFKSERDAEKFLFLTGGTIEKV